MCVGCWIEVLSCRVAGRVCNGARHEQHQQRETVYNSHHASKHGLRRQTRQHDITLPPPWRLPRNWQLAQSYPRVKLGFSPIDHRLTASSASDACTPCRRRVPRAGMESKTSKKACRHAWQRAWKHALTIAKKPCDRRWRSQGWRQSQSSEGKRHRLPHFDETSAPRNVWVLGTTGVSREQTW